MEIASAQISCLCQTTSMKKGCDIGSIRNRQFIKIEAISPVEVFVFSLGDANRYVEMTYIDGGRRSFYVGGYI